MIGKNTMEIITKIFQDKEVFFDYRENEIYLNVTKTAKAFSKNLENWKRSAELVGYLDALSRTVNLTERDLIVVRKGGNDKNAQGTWIHRKLIIVFARWLSPDFAVWCDAQIEEILKTGSYSKSEIQETETDRNLKGLEFAFKHLKVNEASKILMTETLYKDLGLNTNYLPKYSDENHSVSLSSLLKKFDVGMSANKFNKLLVEKGFLEILTRKSSKTKENEKGEKTPIYKEFKSITKKGEEFGSNKVSTQNQLQTQPHYFENKFQELLEIIQIQKTLF